MPPIALTPNETWEYQLRDDYREGKPDPDGTWWTLRAIPAFVMEQIANAVEQSLGADGVIFHTNPGTVDRLYLEHGIVAVRNFKKGNGEDVALKKRTVNGREVIDLAFLDFLEMRHRVELVRAIQNRTKVPPEEGD